MAKNIVLFCDGTGNQYGENNTNNVHMFKGIEQDTSQASFFYDPGVGTSGSKFTGMAFGAGIDLNIKESYEFLMNTYQEGDKIFLIGFSRGAYSVRSLAGMLNMVGLLHKGSRNLIEYAFNNYSQKEKHPFCQGFKKTFSRHCPVHFIGVWDTVKALSPFSHKFHNDKINPEVKYAYQALSIDEKRKDFTPEIWDEKNLAEGQVVEQVWFAGVHSDVGGWYKERGLSDIALKWLVINAQNHGLKMKDNWEEIVNLSCDSNGMIHTSRKGLWRLRGNVERNLKEGAKVHKSVIDRLNNTKIDYKPKNLPENFEVVGERLTALRLVAA